MQHCLWKMLTETGFAHCEQLTEMESITLSRVLKRKYAVDKPHTEEVSVHELELLNSAVDKIVCLVKSMQLQNQKYQAIIEENQSLKSGLRTLIKGSPDNSRPTTIDIDRPIEEVGLSKRTVRILKAVGIDTLQQLRDCSITRLQAHSRIGVKTLHEIELSLANYTV